MEAYDMTKIVDGKKTWLTESETVARLFEMYEEYTKIDLTEVYFLYTHLILRFSYKRRILGADMTILSGFQIFS